MTFNCNDSCPRSWAGACKVCIQSPASLILLKMDSFLCAFVSVYQIRSKEEVWTLGWELWFCWCSISNCSCANASERCLCLELVTIGVSRVPLSTAKPAVLTRVLRRVLAARWAESCVSTETEAETFWGGQLLYREILSVALNSFTQTSAECIAQYFLTVIWGSLEEESLKTSL